MCGVQLLRVTVHERLNSAAEDFLLRVKKGEEPARIRKMRALLVERLTAAAREIVDLFEETLAEYKNRTERPGWEISRDMRLLDAVLMPKVRLHRADVQQLIGCKEESPLKQQLWSPVVEPVDSVFPHAKEEESEIPIGREGELRQGPEVTESIKSTFLIALKSEENDEKPHSSEFHHNLVKENVEDCAQNSKPEGETGPGDKTENSFESETKGSEDDWRETRERRSGSNTRSENPTESDMRANTAQKPFSCSVCGKGFARTFRLDRHMRLHTEDKPFSCSVCGKGFVRTFPLKRHMRIHTGDRPFSCSVCGKAFVTTFPLKRHMRIHTGEKPFSCSECGKEFRQKTHLMKHLLVHGGEKSFSCFVCGEGFKWKRCLIKHMNNHKEEKPIGSSECGKESKLETYLKILDKPFSCTECDKRFAFKSSLNTHLLMHRGIKAFSCSYCGDRFVWRSSLNRHLTLHSGNKPFSCPECNKRFANKFYLKRHAVIHSRDGPLSCSV